MISFLHPKQKVEHSLRRRHLRLVEIGIRFPPVRMVGVEIILSRKRRAGGHQRPARFAVRFHVLRHIKIIGYPVDVSVGIFVIAHHFLVFAQSFQKGRRPARRKLLYGIAGLFLGEFVFQSGVRFDADDVGLVLENPGLGRKTVGTLRLKMDEILKDNLSLESYQLTQGLLFGNKAALDDDFYALSQKMGIAHVFAVSGLHVGLVISFVLLLFRTISRDLNLPMEFPAQPAEPHI